MGVPPPQGAWGWCGREAPCRRGELRRDIALAAFPVSTDTSCTIVSSDGDTLATCDLCPRWDMRR